MSKPEIVASSVFPQSQEYRMPGEKITLSCTAPAGAKVTVKIGGKTYTMKTASKSGGLYPAKFTYTYTIPSYAGSPRNIDLGAPVYTMNYNGTVKTQKAPAKVGVIMKGSPFYAEVSKEDIDTYEAACVGQRRRVRAPQGNGGLCDRYDRQLCTPFVRPLGQENKHNDIYIKGAAKYCRDLGSIPGGTKMGYAQAEIQVITCGYGFVQRFQADRKHFGRQVRRIASFARKFALCIRNIQYKRHPGPIRPDNETRCRKLKVII
jgi:hypothetical protein